MSTLEVRNVSKTIGNKQILKDISFSVSSQEVVGIIGPNGAGKSTLFKILTGLTKPSKGEVLLDSHNIHIFNKDIRNNIGFLIESPSLYDELSGYDNINLCLKLHGAIKNNYIDLVCKKLDISNYLNEKVKKYSQGMKQRLGIVCSLIFNPDFVILDEPTNSLDINGIKDIRDFIKFIKNQGKAVIVSSHMLSEIEEICDRSIIISNGSIVDIVTKDANLNNFTENYIITVPFVENLLEILSDEKYTISKDIVEIRIHKDKFNNTLKLLTKNNINILNIESEKNKLESYFLKKVGNNNG